MTDQILIDELKTSLSKLSSEVFELKSEMATMKSEMLELKEELKSSFSDQNVLKEKIDSWKYELRKYSNHDSEPAIRVDTDVATTIFWTLTPKQHGITQLLFLEYTNVLIAERLGVTEGAAKSYLRNLCDSLAVQSRKEVKEVYEPIYLTIDAKTYSNNAGIAKDWAVLFGKLSFEEAREEDPYFEQTCVTRFRKQKKVKGYSLSPFLRE